MKSNGEPVPKTASTQWYNTETGGWDIALTELYAPFADSVFEIRANAGETIDNIFIAIDGPPAGSPAIVRVLGEAPGYLRDVHNIQQLGSAETILNKVNVTRDIGSVQIEAIGDLIAGRDVHGPIIATTSNNTIRGITSVQAGRHITGDLTAEQGRILLIYSSGGNIGSPTQPINIRAKHAVYQVEASQVHAHVNTRVNGGSGGFFALVCDTFTGSLSTEKLILNQYIPLDGLILIREHFAGSITLGKSYTSPTQYIQLPLQGLTGQIVINADNDTNGAWTSPVRIGPQGDPNQIVLSNPSYAHPPQNLGGGSVGLVPFRLQGIACFPASGATVLHPANEPPLTVQLRHYGPVVRTGNTPLTIERRIAGSAQPFVEIPSVDFAADVSLTSESILNITAAPGKSGFVAGYQYRLKPTEHLRCAVPAAPPVVWGNDYVFTVITPPCVGDVNSDGIVNVNDLLIVIGFWGMTSSAFPAADITGDGLVNVGDLLEVINRWGVCP